MENKEQLRPLTREERKFSEENYHLIMDFMKKSKLDAEEFFDIVVFDFLLSVEKYLNDLQLQAKCSFEAVSYMYMKQAIFVHFRKQKAQKRGTEAGSDISLDSMDMNISNHSTMETASNMEYMEMVKQIENGLTEEQRKIFSDKVQGYSLKEIAENHGINHKRVYKQFEKVKRIVTEVMEA
jgi:RNA polymerase sigma factor (sigma-70 family)